jgi:DNA-binding FadR family transcriptional regulator
MKKNSANGEAATAEPRLYRVVAERVQQMIQDDSIAPGARLPAERELADRNFHLAIARATGNTALVGVVEYLWNNRGSLWHKLKEHYQTEELRLQTLPDHRKILEAIAAHDPAGARHAMRSHLERVTRTFSRG